MVHAIAVGACSTAGGGAGDKESFNASSNKENESNADVQSPRRPLLQGDPSPQFRRSSENIAPSSLSITNKTKKRSFSEVDNTDTHGNEGLSNVLLMGYDRCTKFFRGALSRIPLFGTATNDSATSNNDQHNESRIVPFPLSDRHHRQRQRELLRQSALQFHAARDADETLRQKKYSDRIGPPLQGDVDGNNLPYDVAIRNIQIDLFFNSRQQRVVERLNQRSAALVATTTKSVTWCEEVQLFEYDQHEGIQHAKSVTWCEEVQLFEYEQSDIEYGSSDDSSDEEEEDAELDAVSPREDDEETVLPVVTMQMHQQEDDETVEEVVPHNEEAEEEDNQAGNYDKDGLQISAGAGETLENGVLGMELHSTADDNPPTSSPSFCCATQALVEEEEDEVEQSYMQQDEVVLHDDGTGDEEMLSHKDQEESQDDAMLDMEEEQVELPEEAQMQEHEQDEEDLVPRLSFFADVKCHLGDLMNDAHDVDDPDQDPSSLFCDRCDRVVLGEMYFGPAGLQYCLSCVESLGSEAYDKIMSDPSLKDIRGQLIEDVVRNHDFSILTNKCEVAGTLGRQSDDTNRDDDADSSSNQDDASNFEEEDNASTATNASTKSWSDLKKYKRILQETTYFRGQIQLNRIMHCTHAFGSALAALLEQECLWIASKSAFNDGTIRYCKPLHDMTLEQWKIELREAEATLQLIPDTSKFFEKEDLCGEDVIVSTLHAVASKLKGPLLANWKCSSAILKSLAADLVQIADGERHEFPWRDTDIASAKSWSDLKTYQRIQLVKKSFRGQIQRNNIEYYTHGFGSAPAALLEQECLWIASKSAFNDGKISYCKLLHDMALEQWKIELREFIQTLQSIPDTSKFFEKEDLCGEDVVDSTLRAVASKLTGPLPANWSCCPAILKSLAADLVQIADGERHEFPWRVAEIPPNDLPSNEEFLADRLQLLRDLNNPDPEQKKKTRNILRRSQRALYKFACAKTQFGHFGPPSSETRAKVKCARQELADRATKCWFLDLIEDVDFLNWIPDEYKNDPFKMPLDLRKELMHGYFVSLGVFPPGYTPPFFAPEGSFSVNASAEEVKNLKLRKTAELKKDGNLERLRREIAEFEAEDELYHEEQHMAHVDFIEQHMEGLVVFIESYQHTRKDPGATLKEFNCQFNDALVQIPGFSKFSTDDFPTVKSIDEDTWNNRKNADQRREAMAKVKSEVLAVLKPRRIKFSDQVLELGQCCYPGCTRKRGDYNGSSCFQGSHIIADGKRAIPSILAKSTDGRLEHEMKTLGIQDVCGCHHDYGDVKRTFLLDITKHFKLIPLPKPDRGEGKNLLDELITGRVLRMKLACVVMERYIRGWSTNSPPIYGDYNTLRVVIDAYFERFADDYTVPTAEQWDSANLKNRQEHFVQTLRYILQDYCGVCGAATDMTGSDFTCKEGDFDLRNMTPLERQSAEADHDISTSKRKEVSHAFNVLEMIDELCHAIYLCYFCHKKRTANQHKKNSWSTEDRDYGA